MTITKSLSSGDAAVLGALFDPEASLQSHPRIDVRTRGPYDSTTLSHIKDKERAAVLLTNNDRPTIAQLQEAISGLSDIIASYPQYPSAWNNRAQARRLLYDIDTSGTRTQHLQDTFPDLAQAINLTSPKTALQSISPDNAKVLASAHTHRGYLLWNASRPDAPSDMLSGIEGLTGLSKERLEELASRDFALGGKYGNQTARQLAVKTNPYAKLCGSIVREAMRKEVEDFYGRTEGTQ